MSQEAANDAQNSSPALMDFVGDVPVQLSVEIGGARLLVRELLALEAGSVVPLDRQSGELADVRINGRLVARGDVTTADDRIAVRIVEVIASERR